MTVEQHVFGESHLIAAIMRLSIVILTVALATVCNGGKGTNMANDYLISKWKTMFQFDDVNKDGIISSADLEKTSDTTLKLHHIDAEKTKEVKTQYGKMWNDFHFEGHIREINESQFVNDLNAEFSTKKHQFYDRIARYMYTIYTDVIDSNKDWFISEEEFIIDFRTYGYENVESIKRVFKAYQEDPIPLSTAVQSWVSFMTEEDESKDFLKNMKNSLESVIRNV